MKKKRESCQVWLAGKDGLCDSRITSSSVMADNDEKLVTEDDRHHVIVRPKAIVGSSGSIWARETIRLRHEDPAAFEVEKTETNAEHSLWFRKCCARLHDDLFLYYDMTESDDLNKITEEHNCKFYAYEKQRAGHLKLRLEKMLQLSEVTEMSEHNKSLLAFSCDSDHQRHFKCYWRGSKQWCSSWHRRI